MFLISSLSTAYAIDKSECLSVIFDELEEGGRPIFWAQRLLRPKDPLLYLNQVEIDRPLLFSTVDEFNIAYDHPEFVGLEAQGDKGKGKISNHGSQTLGLIYCPQSECSILPDKKGFHWYKKIDRNNDLHEYIKHINSVRSYNSQQEDQKKKIRVISISLKDAGWERPEMQELLDKLEEEDEVTVVLAAGNNSGKKVYSRVQSEALTVVSAMSESVGRIFEQSNIGPAIDFSAPSDQSQTSVGRLKFGATSGAAPLIAASLLTIHKVKPEISSSMARAILKATATDIGRTGKDHMFGWGLPNIPLAASLARKIQPHELIGKNEETMVDYLKVKLRQYQVIHHLESLRRFQDQLLLPLRNGCEDGGQSRNQSILTVYDDLQKAKNCVEYANLFDQLLNQYFLSGGTEKVHLCEFFVEHKLKWGILNFCSIEKIVKTLGVEVFYKESNLFHFLGDIDTSGEGQENALKIFGGKKKHQEFIEKAIKYDPDRAMRDILSHDEIFKLYPGKWEEWVRSLINNSNKWQKREIAKYVLNHDFVLNNLDQEKFIDLFQDTDLLPLLQNQKFLHENPKEWKKLAREFLNKNTANGRSQFLFKVPGIIDLFPDLFEQEIKSALAGVGSRPPHVVDDLVQHILVGDMDYYEKNPKKWKELAGRYLNRELKKGDSGGGWIGYVLGAPWVSQKEPEFFKVWMQKIIDQGAPLMAFNILTYADLESIEKKTWKSFYNQVNHHVSLTEKRAKFQSLGYTLIKRAPKDFTQLIQDLYQTSPIEAIRFMIEIGEKPEGESELFYFWMNKILKEHPNLFFEVLGGDDKLSIITKMIQDDPRYAQILLTKLQELKKAGVKVAFSIEMTGKILADPASYKLKNWARLVEEYADEAPIIQMIHYLIDNEDFFKKDPKRWEKWHAQVLGTLDTNVLLRERYLSSNFIREKKKADWVDNFNKMSSHILSTSDEFIREVFFAKENKKMAKVHYAKIYKAIEENANINQILLFLGHGEFANSNQDSFTRLLERSIKEIPPGQEFTLANILQAAYTKNLPQYEILAQKFAKRFPNVAKNSSLRMWP